MQRADAGLARGARVATSATTTRPTAAQLDMISRNLVLNNGVVSQRGQQGPGATTLPPQRSPRRPPAPCFVRRSCSSRSTSSAGASRPTCCTSTPAATTTSRAPPTLGTATPPPNAHGHWRAEGAHTVRRAARTMAAHPQLWHDQLRDLLQQRPLQQRAVRVRRQLLRQRVHVQPYDQDRHPAHPFSPPPLTPARLSAGRVHQSAGAFCQASLVSRTEGIFAFNDTDAGETATVPCPLGYVGQATRLCKANGNNMYGVWEEPTILCTRTRSIDRGQAWRPLPAQRLTFEGSYYRRPAHRSAAMCV